MLMKPRLSVRTVDAGRRCCRLEGLQLGDGDTEARGQITQVIDPVQAVPDEGAGRKGSTRDGRRKDRDPGRGRGKGAADIGQSAASGPRSSWQPGRRPSGDRQRTSEACPNCAAKLLPSIDPAKGLLELPGRALAFLAEASELAQDLVATLEADRLVDDIATAGHQVPRKFWA